MCKILEISRSGYHEWLDRKPSRRASENAAILTVIKAINAEVKGAYGSPRMTCELKDRGFRPAKTVLPIL